MVPHSWCHPLLLAIQQNPGLAPKHQGWRSSSLSDLAFAIEGRRQGLRQLVQFIDENLGALGRVLKHDGGNVATHVAGRYAYVFQDADEAAFQRVLVGAASFLREARSCFENLADFRAEFLAHYLGARLPGDKKSRYEALNKVLGRPKWIEDLRDLRGDLTHYRYPWLCFRVRSRGSPKYEPVLVLDWRPEAAGPSDRIPFSTLRRIRSGIWSAARRVAGDLAERTRARQGRTRRQRAS